MATLFSKGKDRLLESILDNPSRTPRVRELARLLKLSPAHISRTLKALDAYGIIEKGEVDLSNPYVRALKIFLNTKKLVDKDVAKLLRRLEPIGVGLYGSWFNGTNDEESDLDIWVRVEVHPGEARVVSVSNDVRKIMGRGVQILVLTPERIDRMKKEDPIFYYSLVFGSMTLCGEPIE